MDHRKRSRTDDNPFNLTESIFDTHKKTRHTTCEDIIKHPSAVEKPDILKCISDKLHSFYQDRNGLPTFMFTKTASAPVGIFSQEGLLKHIDDFGPDIAYAYIASYVAFLEHMSKLKLLRVLEYIIYSSLYFVE